MPTGTEIAEKVKNVLSSELKVGLNDLHPGKKIAEDFGVDSIQRIELVMRLEEAFGIKIPDDEATSLITVQDAIDYIARRLSVNAKG